eukprot:CAMPEP_0203983608 /NCGR_PEP_ID=MMETSP0360-20130528/3969_1 /ASSEMBLY_ACC=CAM_ASM_000342 /TAXON_ID=268821 /ORGANISM="Scrippsiella Hangoei, Strain SHTV-5" /LENGTH=53 /DNA_ID=CAMNT_0050922545 /DNA_START=107 /DNA_END=265 /DNA_ORIENTATION=+
MTLTSASVVISTTTSSSVPVRGPGSPIRKLNRMVATSEALATSWWFFHSMPST